MLYTSDGSTKNFGFWIGSCTYLYDMFHTPGWKGVSEISVFNTSSGNLCRNQSHCRLGTRFQSFIRSIEGDWGRVARWP